MSEFIKKLRAFAIELKQEQDVNISDYVAVIEQNIGRLDKVIEELNTKLDYHFYYDNTETAFLNLENLIIYMIDSNGVVSKVRYQLELKALPNGYGYCNCEPTDSFYDKEHQCCGVSCEYDLPNIIINRIETLDNLKYTGLPRELWGYERELFQKEEVEDDKLEYILDDLSNEDLRELQERILNKLNEVK